MKVRLTAKEEARLTFQDYAPSQNIDGVFYHPLKKHAALEGWFMEYARLTAGTIDGLPAPLEARQISFARAVPDRINAFHVHPKQTQDEIWCVVDGAMMVWLVDIRADSPTSGRRRRYMLTADAPALLYIPTGVAHGYKAGPEGALLVYTMNSQFNLADPNEGRLPWDHFGAEIWEADRG